MLELGVKRDQESRVNGLRLRKKEVKKIESHKGIEIKNKFSILDRINDNIGNGYRLCILGDLNGWIGDMY